MSEDTPGRQLVTMGDQSPETADVSESALITPEMRLELMTARLDGLASQNRKLAHDNDDLRQENRRLLASAAQRRGENLAVYRAHTPVHATADELGVLSRRLEQFGQALQADRDAREQATERARADGVVIADAAATQAARVVAGLHATLSADTVEQLANAVTRQSKDTRYEDAAAMLQAIQRSTSWRLTGPVRAVGRVLRR